LRDCLQIHGYNSRRHNYNISIEVLKRSMLNFLVRIYHGFEMDAGHMKHVLHVTNCGITFCYIMLYNYLSYKHLKQKKNSPFVKTPYMVQNRSREASSPSTLTINSSHFMEQKGSVQYWQQPTTLPDPNQFHPVHGFSAYFFQNNLLLSTRLRVGLLRGLFASRFPTKLVFQFLISHTCYMISSSHTPWHVIPTTSGTQYEAWSFLLQN